MLPYPVNPLRRLIAKIATVEVAAKEEHVSMRHALPAATQAASMLRNAIVAAIHHVLVALQTASLAIAYPCTAVSHMAAMVAVWRAWWMFWASSHIAASLVSLAPPWLTLRKTDCVLAPTLTAKSWSSCCTPGSYLPFPFLLPKICANCFRWLSISSCVICSTLCLNSFGKRIGRISAHSAICHSLLPLSLFSRSCAAEPRIHSSFPCKATTSRE